VRRLFLLDFIWRWSFLFSKVVLEDGFAAGMVGERLRLPQLVGVAVGFGGEAMVAGSARATWRAAPRSAPWRSSWPPPATASGSSAPTGSPAA
jgi:hypothetical protein